MSSSRDKKNPWPNPPGRTACALLALGCAALAACGTYEAVDGELTPAFAQTTLALKVDVSPSEGASMPDENTVAYRVTGERAPGQRADCAASTVSRCVRPRADGSVELEGLCNGSWNLRVAVVEEGERRCEDDAPPVGNCHDGDRDDYPLTLHAGSNAHRVRCHLRPASFTFVVNIL